MFFTIQESATAKQQRIDFVRCDTHLDDDAEISEGHNESDYLDFVKTHADYLCPK